MGNPGKPRIAVFTLGGTIAMQAAPGEGMAPALSASDLLAAVPGLDDAGVELRMQDVANKPGASLSFCDLFGLADTISAAVGDGFGGVVVIQGTDTIEETAYLLDLLVCLRCPDRYCHRGWGAAISRLGQERRPLFAEHSVGVGQSAFNAPQSLWQIDDIGGLYVGSASYACSIAPER